MSEPATDLMKRDDDAVVAPVLVLPAIEDGLLPLDDAGGAEPLPEHAVRNKDVRIAKETACEYQRTRAM